MPSRARGAARWACSVHASSTSLDVIWGRRIRVKGEGSAECRKGMNSSRKVLGAADSCKGRGLGGVSEGDEQ